MKFYRLTNPREGVKAARIAEQDKLDGCALLIVDLAEDRKTGDPFLLSMEMESDFKGLNGAKISYAKKYQSKGKGHEKARWVESKFVSEILRHAQGERISGSEK